MSSTIPKTGKALMELIRKLSRPGDTTKTDSSSKVDEIVYGV